MATKQKTIGSKVVNESDEVKNVAAEMIKKNTMDFGPAEILYLMIEPAISKTVAARCLKATMEVKYYTDADYVIEVSREIWDGLTEETKAILIYNQLSKIDPRYDDKEQIWKFKLAKFDSVGFSHIIKKHGLKWVDEIRTVIESVYDLDSTESRKIGI